MDSHKAWQTTVGHEITHVFEGTEFYNELRTAVQEYARRAGTLDKATERIKSLYSNIENADLDAELTAELVGEYLFTDEAFVRNLSTEHRNVFQKIYDEIKYLAKVVTAGSKEARQLEKVKHIFDKMYRESEVQKNTVKDGEVKYSISKTSKMPYDYQLNLIEKGQLNGSNSLYIGTPSEQLQSAGLSDAPFAMNQGDYRKSRRKSGNNKKYSSHAVPYAFFEKMPQYLSEAPMIIDNGEKATVITSYGMKDTRGKDSFVIAGVWKDQQMENDTVNQVKSAYPWDDFIEQITRSAEGGKLIITNKNKAEKMLTTIGVQPSEVSRIFSLANNSIPQLPPNVNTPKSLSPLGDDFPIRPDLRGTPASELKYEDFEAEKKNLNKKLYEIRSARRETSAQYREAIFTLQAEYDAKEVKTTKSAQRLLEKIKMLEDEFAAYNAEYKTATTDIKAELAALEKRRTAAQEDVRKASSLGGNKKDATLGGVRDDSVNRASHGASSDASSDTADRINGLERPKPNEGYALTNGISDNSISQSTPNVKQPNLILGRLLLYMC